MIEGYNSTDCPCCGNKLWYNPNPTISLILDPVAHIIPCSCKRAYFISWAQKWAVDPNLISESTDNVIE